MIANKRAFTIPALRDGTRTRDCVFECGEFAQLFQGIERLGLVPEMICLAGSDSGPMGVSTQ